ncbi:MAG: response regulator transcription factor [Clostridiales bacterium]|jgi:DNA-binding response OmpR family regulator|nr:response regulator transcription factor [Clostridiales bacterium]
MDRTVLLIEDNEKLNVINRRALESAGYHVLTALTLAAAREHLAAHNADVILLDVLLPDGDGADFCGEIREKTDAHILFLTSKREHVDKLKGLATGGDDYITKPFKLDELLLRVAAAMRRRDMEAAKPPVQTMTVGPLTLDSAAIQAFLNGKDIGLSPKEFSVLRLLVQSKGKAISKEALYESAWNQPMNVDDTAIKTAISRLRRKLGSEGFRITSSRGEGYRFE